MHLVYNADWPARERRVSRVGALTTGPATPSPAVEMTLGFSALARMLGVWHRSDRWVAAYLQALIDEDGFPRPLPTLARAGLSHAIHPRTSRWLAIGVHAWFRDQGPLGAVATVDGAKLLEAVNAAALRLIATSDRHLDGDAA